MDLLTALQIEVILNINFGKNIKLINSRLQGSYNFFLNNYREYTAMQFFIRLFEGFSLLNTVLTVLAFLVVGFIYRIFIKPFFQIRAYKNIPGVLVTYKIGTKAIWEHKNSVGEPLEFDEDSPFYRTENNTLLLKYPNLKAIVTNLAHNPHITIIDHNLTAEIIKNPDYYMNFLRNTMFGKVYGRYAMIFSTPAVWKRQRKVISGAFDFDSMRKIMPIIQEVAKEFFENETFTNGKEPQALQQFFLAYTWEALSRSFFGDDLKNFTPGGEPFSKIINAFVKRQFSIFMSLQYQIFGNTAALWNSTIRRERKRLFELGKFVENMVEIISGRIKRGELKNADGRKGILELILENSNENDSLTNMELMGNFFGFSFAGTDTSSNTASNLLYCLAANPEIKQKVIEDIQTHWDGQSPLTPEILNKIEYLHASLLETLRVMSPVPFLLPRVAIRDHMIGDIPIKKGYLVQAYFSPTLFSPWWIKNPEQFQPERWIKGREAYQQLEDVFIFNPFSFGPRNCIGQHFAMTQMKIAMCYFLPRFEFSLPPDFKLSPMVRRATMEPREPIKMFIKPKSNWKKN